MNRSTRDWRILAPAVAALLLVACSSSNNNKKANSNSNTVAPATTVAAAGTATPAATAARPASPSPATPAARTATPAVAVTTAARTATPGARTATPLARPGSPTAGGGTADEKLLASIALTEADLPNGFSKQNDESTPPSVAGQTADYSATFTKLGQSASGLDVQAIVVGLAAFKDGPTATAGFKDLQKQVIEQSGGDFSTGRGSFTRKPKNRDARSRLMASFSPRMAARRSHPRFSALFLVRRLLQAISKNSTPNNV